MPNLSGLALIILSTGLVLQVVSAAKLLPFGDAAKHRDSKQVLTNDSSFTINNLTQPLTFFGREYHSIIVSRLNFKHPKKIFEILATQKIPPFFTPTLRK